MREVARREAMEPMRVQCLNVATNQTASITVMSRKSHSCTSPFADRSASLVCPWMGRIGTRI